MEVVISYSPLKRSITVKFAVSVLLIPSTFIRYSSAVLLTTKFAVVLIRGLLVASALTTEHDTV